MDVDWDNVMNFIQCSTEASEKNLQMNRQEANMYET